MGLRTFFMFLGFLLFIFGIVALVLMLVGLQLSFLAWLDSSSRMFGLTLRLLMVFGGIVMFYFARTDFRNMGE